MDNLPDRAANASLLNNSTEQYSDISTREPSQSNQNHLGSSEEKPNDVIQSLFPDDRFWSIVHIVGGFVIAVALAVGHHIFLKRINGRNINELSQVWIKGVNNGFSNIFSILVGLSAGTALTQMKWRASGTQPLQIYTIDNLFALPAPLALLKTIVRPWGSPFFLILSSVLIHTLFFVSILAPSALTVDLIEAVPRDIEVPVFNLASQVVFAVWDLDSSNSSLVAVGLSPAGQIINDVFFDLTGFTWDIPPSCDSNCAFHYQYDAPALECHDVIPGDSASGSQDHARPLDIYANTNLYLPPNLTASPNLQIDVDAPYDLSINYTIVTLANLTHWGLAGTYCRFHQATYNASFELDGNGRTQRVRTSIISRGDYLMGENGRPNSESEGRGPVVINSFPRSSPDPVLIRVFDPDASAFSYESQARNVSQALVDIFSNLTLGLISRGGPDVVPVHAMVSDGSTVWIYTPWILWAVYLPAVILAIAVALYGLRTIQLSGITMDDKFSTFLLATQNAKLYEMCGEAADFEELQRFQLIHQKKGAFLVVNSGVGSPN